MGCCYSGTEIVVTSCPSMYVMTSDALSTSSVFMLFLLLGRLNVRPSVCPSTKVSCSLTHVCYGPFARDIQVLSVQVVCI